MNKILLFIFQFSLISADPCAFNGDCECLDVGGDKRKVSCLNLVDFPIFTTTSISNVTTFEISGTFTSIPKLAFSNLTGIINYLGIIRSGETSLPLSVDNYAFANTNENFFNLIYFGNFYSLTSVPTVALAKASGLAELYFTKSNFNVLQNDAFSGMKLNNLVLTNNNILSVDNYAFRGLETYLNHLKINEKLSSIPVQATKPLTSLISLDLSSNQIIKVDDNSFSTNLKLQTLNLDSNLITDVGLTSTSFSNTASLAIVSFDKCQLQSLPITALLPLNRTLATLSLSYNQITQVTSYAFGQFNSLQSIDLSFNPITVLEPYAFDGLQEDSYNVEMLDSLQTVALDVFAGMPNANTVGFHHCDDLVNITSTDASKLPTTLQYVAITMMPNLQYIDSSIQDWLKLSPTNILNIKGFSNFNCNPSISWMYPLMFCQSVPQIYDIASSITCGNTKTELQTYLKSLQLSC